MAHLSSNPLFCFENDLDCCESYGDRVLDVSIYFCVFIIVILSNVVERIRFNSKTIIVKFKIKLPF